MIMTTTKNYDNTKRGLTYRATKFPKAEGLPSQVREAGLSLLNSGVRVNDETEPNNRD